MLASGWRIDGGETLSWEPETGQNAGRRTRERARTGETAGEGC